MALRALLIAILAGAQSAAAISKCSAEFNGLLANDPNGDPKAFLRCQGNSGAWQRQLCPGELVFDFVNQQCTTPERKPREPTTLNIAILNNSCARGEQCIGGTICDPIQKKCLCPAGSTPVIESLSCEVKNVNQQPSSNMFQQKPEMPAALSNIFPNPAVQKFIESFFKPNQNYIAEKSGSDFKPNPNSNFVFQSFATTATPARKNVMVPPGATCREGEICGGGSICAQPFGMCLCPGDKEARNGECVVPLTTASPTMPTLAPVINIIKVGLGAMCGEPAVHCADEGAACVNGLCSCISPLIQMNGQCVRAQVRKEVGPGEPCDEGEICTKGSVCDAVIPVCVCPPATDLSNGQCVSLSRPAPVPLGPVPNGVPSYLTPTTVMPTMTTTKPTTQTSPAFVTTAAPVVLQPYQPSTLSYKNIPVVPVEVRTTTYVPTAKPNQMKIQLGGSKQAGVGVACTLNTDCMIGAYCNGNTQPATCQCLSTHVNVEGRCEKVIYPGQSGCMADSQCTAAYTGSACVDRVCVCPVGSRAIEQTCVPEVASAYGSCDLFRVTTNNDYFEPFFLPACPPLFACIHQNCLPVSDLPCTSSLSCRGYSCTMNDDCEPSIRSKRSVRGCVEADEYGCMRCADGYTLQDGDCEPARLELGQFCDPATPSPRCKEDSICLNGLCTCRVPGGCSLVKRTRRYPDERCTEGDDCQRGAVCHQGVCRCKEGEELVAGSCHRIAGAFKSIGIACSPYDRCSGGSVCDAGVCSCTEGARELNGHCVQPPLGRCSYGQTCTGDSACEFGVCRCAAGSAVAPTGVCAPSVAQPGESCQLGQRCVEGSVCRFGVCLCTGGKWSANGRCVRKTSIVELEKSSTMALKVTKDRHPGDVCTNDHVCIGGAICQKGYCRCAGANEIIINSVCVPSPSTPVVALSPTIAALIAPGQRCKVGETECAAGTTCLGGYCTCPEGQIVDPTGVCAPRPPPYTFYSYPAFGSSNNTEPNNGSITRLEPGAKCSSTVQCPFQTECIRGVCRCKQGETIFEGGCRPAVREVSLGLKCDPKHGLDCIGEARCIYGKCSCTKGLVPVEKECVDPGQMRKARPGSPCDSQTICLGGAKCIGGVCGCPVGQTPDANGRCTSQPTAAPTPTEPSVNPILGSLPPSNQISVRVGDKDALRTLVEQHYQLPGVGEACEEICKDGAACINNICACTGDFKESRGRCVDKRDINDVLTETYYDGDERMDITLYGHECNSPAECPRNSFCFEHLCRCMHGFRAHAGTCEPVVGLGGVCMSPSQCAHHATCVNGRCACAGDGAAPIGGRCPTARLARPGDDCARGQVCSFNSYCGLASGVCECPGGMATIDAKCEQTRVEPGEACVTSRNCHKFSYCDNGFCICKTGYALVNGFCVPLNQHMGPDSPYFMAINRPSDVSNDFPGMPPNRNNGGAGALETMLASSGSQRTFQPEHPIKFTTIVVPNENQAPGQPSQVVVPPRPSFNPSFSSFPNSPNIFNFNNPPVPASTTAPPFKFVFNPSLFSQSTTTTSARPTFNPMHFTPKPLTFNSFPTMSTVAPNLLQNQNPLGQTNQPTLNPNPFGFSNKALPTPTPFTFNNFVQPNLTPTFGTTPAQPFNPWINRNQPIVTPTFAPPTTTPANPFMPMGAMFPHHQNQNTPPNPFNLPPAVMRSFFPDGRLPGVIPPSARGVRTQSGDSTSSTTGVRTPMSSFPLVTRAPELSAIVKGNTAMPGEFCGDGSACLANSICKRHFCRCSKGSYAENGICVRKSVARKQAFSPEDAFTPDSLFVNDDNLEEELNEAAWTHPRRVEEEEDNEEEPKRRQFAAPLENCANDEFCTGGAECLALLGLGKVCQCPIDTILSNDECIPPSTDRLAVGVRDKCNVETNICIGGARCSKGKCTCPKGKQERFGICVKLSNPGDSCEDGELCGDGSFCSDSARTCVCPAKTKAVKGRCRPTPKVNVIRFNDTKPGEECGAEDDGQQCGDGATCEGGVCTCPEDTLLVHGRCVPDLLLRDLGEECSSNTVCMNEAECLEGLCQCPQDRTDIEGECMLIPKNVARAPPKRLPIGSMMCEVDENCPLSYQCLNSICVCNLSSVECLGQLLLSSDFVCGSDRDCPPGAVCVEIHGLEQCACPDGTVSTVGGCIAELKVAPGGYCRSTSECAGSGICLDERCVCDFKSVVKNDQCVVRAGLAGVGGACGFSGHCQNDLVCLEGTCTCLEWMECEQANEPVTSPPGGSCSEARTCTGGAVCREGWCVCPNATMVVQKGECVASTRMTTAAPKTSPISFGSGRKAVPGAACSKPYETCINGEDCCGGSACNEFKFCACPTDRPIVIDGECNPKTTVVAGGICDERTNVCSEGATCTNGICTCPSGSIAVSGKCVASPAPTPVQATNVVPPQVTFKFSETTPSPIPVITPAMSPERPLVGPLKNCENGEICTGGSSCDADTGVCLCPSGQVAFGDRCAIPPAFHSIPSTAQPTTTTTTTTAQTPLKGLPQLPAAQAATKAPTSAPIAATADPIITTTESTTSLMTTTSTQKPFVLAATTAPRCGSDANCSGDKVCAAGGCVCRSGTVENAEGVCEQVKVKTVAPSFRRMRYGSRCSSPHDPCENGAYCIDGVCKCAPGNMLSIRGYCEPIVAVTTTTTTPRPAPITVPSTTTRRPIHANGLALGARCWSDSSCPENAVCVQKICVCKPKYMEDSGYCIESSSSNNGEVYMQKALGEFCITPGECPMDADCLDGVCACPRNHIFRSGRCKLDATMAAPGDSCADGQTCTGGSMCCADSKKCICAADHSIRGGRCSSDDAPPFVGPYQSCSSGQRCSGGSVCTRGICVCDDDHLAEDGYCRPIAAPNADVALANGVGLRFKSKISTPRGRSLPCDPSKCKLPECFCTPTGRQPPGGLNPVDTPQFVVLTFDDAVNGRTLPDYKRLFEKTRFKNPNGCPIKGTFFISHEWTNYDGVQWIQEGGHEMASNSITHVSLEGSPTARWLSEMDGMRRIMAKFGNAREEDIVGMRAPQLAAGGDAMFEMMSRAGFIYDNSIPANGGKGSEPYWPQTMDYRPSFPCHGRPCPKRSYPGVWEIPLNQFYGPYLPQIGAHQRSSMMRAAVPLNASVHELYEMLRVNLDRSKDTNRAPLVLTLNADYLQLNEENSGMQALERFLDSLASDPSVYVVTMKQLIEWMREPTPLGRIRESAALKCPIGFASYPAGREQCSKPNKCIYRTPGMNSPEHQFLTCAPCPETYPWLTNPIGN